MVCFYSLLIEFLNEYILYLIHVIYQLAFNSGIFVVVFLTVVFLVYYFFIEACNAGDLVQSLRLEDPLEEGMATDFSILAWRVPRDRGAWRSAVHWVLRVRHD